MMITKKSEVSCSKVLDVLYGGLEASSLALKLSVESPKN
jgi:hypothetical protein